MKQINILKKAAGAISILLLLLSLAACGNMLEETKDNTVVEPVENTGAGILVRGEIKVQGAVPSRAATSCFDGTFSWRIEAQNLDITDNTDPNFLVNSFTTTNRFTITLPCTGNWLISASGYAGTFTNETLPSSSKVFSGFDSFTITEEGSTRAIIIHPVVWGDSLFPAQGANPLKGSINLPITSNAENVYQVSAKLVKNNSSSTATEEVVTIPPKTFTAGSSSLEASDVPAGVYTAKIIFEDAVGNILYSCYEAISVYPGLTTDTWYGTAPYLHNGAFTLTSSLVEKYGAELVPSTNYVLYNYNSGTYQYYLKDTPSASVSGTEDMSASSSSFCFDADGTLYSLTENIDGDIVKTSNNKTFTLSDSYLTGVLVDLKTNIFYTYKANQGTLNFTKYPNLISGGDTETSESYNNVYVPGNNVYYETGGGDENGKARMTICDGIVYIIARTDYGSGDYVFGWYNLTSATNGTFDFTDNSEVETLLSTGNIRDIIYQDGSVYMLLDGTKDEFLMDFKYSSRGAVLCYNCQTEEVTVCGWIDDATDISGKVFYAINGADNKTFLKQNASFIEDGDEKAAYIANRANWITIDDTIPSGSGVYPSLYFPSEAQANSAFYGPKKFIAIKPKKLVIADEGCFFYTDSNDAFCFKNVNRVVTVDLESFAISSVDDVSVTFGEDESSDMVSSGYTSVDNLNLSNCIYSTSGSEYNSSSMESVKLSIPLGE